MRGGIVPDIARGQHRLGGDRPQCGCGTVLDGEGFSSMREGIVLDVGGGVLHTRGDRPRYGGDRRRYGRDRRRCGGDRLQYGSTRLLPISMKPKKMCNLAPSYVLPRRPVEPRTKRHGQRMRRTCMFHSILNILGRYSVSSTIACFSSTAACFSSTISNTIRNSAPR